MSKDGNESDVPGSAESTGAESTDADRDLEDLLASYVDRVTAGEKMNREELLAKHPRAGANPGHQAGDSVRPRGQQHRQARLELPEFLTFRQQVSRWSTRLSQPELRWARIESSFLERTTGCVLQSSPSFRRCSSPRVDPPTKLPDRPN